MLGYKNSSYHVYKYYFINIFFSFLIINLIYNKKFTCTTGSICSPIIKISYFASLFEALKPSYTTHSNIAPSGLVNTIPALKSFLVVDSSPARCH